MSDFSGPAELPRRIPDTRFNPPAIFTHLHYPTTATEFQDAINSCVDGDCVVVPLDTFVGNFNLPARANAATWAYIMPLSKVNGTFGLTPSRYMRNVEETQGQRVGYQHSKAVTGGSCILPQIQTDTFLPAFSCDTSSKYWWVEGLEIGMTPGNTNIVENSLFNTGGPTNTTTLIYNQVPQYINIGHCLFHGSPTQQARRGVYANGGNVGIRDCSFWHIWESGADSQCVGWWNSPGSIAILNCFGECGSENVLSGGAGPHLDTLPEDVMKDVTIWDCHWTKDPTRSGLVKKNLVESKNGGRIYVKNCIMEHNTVDGQTGTSSQLLIINNENQNPPIQDVADVAYENVLVYGGGALFNFSGVQVQEVPAGTTQYTPTTRTRNVHATNIYGKHICGTLPEAAGSTGFITSLFNGVTNVLMDHITAEAATVGLEFDDSGGVIAGVATKAAVDLEVRDCLFGKGIYSSLFGSNGTGSAALAYYVQNPNIHNNVFYNPSGAAESDNPVAGNFYVTEADVGFASYTTQDPGALASTSAYHNKATDATDIGANLTTINAMETAVRETVLPWTPNLPSGGTSPVTIALPSTLTMTQGATGTLTISATQNGGPIALQSVSATSDNTGVATVTTTTTTVTVTGVAAGTCNVSVTSAGITSNICAVTVSAPAPTSGGSTGHIKQHPVKGPKKVSSGPSSTLRNP